MLQIGEDFYVKKLFNEIIALTTRRVARKIPQVFKESSTNRKSPLSGVTDPERGFKVIM